MERTLRDGVMFSGEEEKAILNCHTIQFENKTLISREAFRNEQGSCIPQLPSLFLP